MQVIQEAISKTWINGEISCPIHPYNTSSRYYTARCNRIPISKLIAKLFSIQNLSANLSQQITLDTLFSAPVRRLAYYKQLYYVSIAWATVHYN